MTKRLRIAGGVRSVTTLSSTLSEFAENLKRERPGKSSEIDAMVANYKEQMRGGGIAVEEAKIALLTAFPSVSNNGSHRPKRLKGRNTKR